MGNTRQRKASLIATYKTLLLFTSSLIIGAILASNIRGVCNLSGKQGAERVWKGGSSMTFSTRSLLHLLILRLLLAYSVSSSSPPSSFVVRLELHTSIATSPAGFELMLSLVALLVNKPGILLGVVEEVKI